MTLTRSREEAGFTLIELLVSVSLLGLLMSALSGAVLVGLRTTNDTRTSLGQSNTEQLVSTYLTKDIQAAVTVRTSGTSTCGNQAIVLETTTRTDPLAASNVNVIVAYALTGTNLVRQVCGPAPSVHTIARNITSLTASGANPVSITVATAPSVKVGAYSWTIEVRRRQT